MSGSVLRAVMVDATHAAGTTGDTDTDRVAVVNAGPASDASL